MTPTAGFEVLAPGPLTLLQDDGRFGYLHRGLTIGGPLDRLSFDWANRLCGNRAGTAALEITLGGLRLKALVPTRIALTGATAPVHINGRAADTWRSHNLAPGDRLEIGTATSGCRLYLAVAGGFQATGQFGSVAAVQRERLGGHSGGGAALAAGDRLFCAPVEPDRCFAVPAELRPPCGGSAILHMIPCLDSRRLLRPLRRQLFAQEYRVSSACDRMGYRLEGMGCRLEGEALSHSTAALLSAGLVLGTVQLPPDGQPIVLMNDHQTIGGYPKAGVVASGDLRLLAQLRPGETVRFRPVTPDGSLNLAKRQWRAYERACPRVCQPV